MAKKKREMKQFTVPMKWEHRGHATVDAYDAEEALAKAEAGNFGDGVELFEAGAELINWEVTGEATEEL